MVHQTKWRTRRWSTMNETTFGQLIDVGTSDLVFGPLLSLFGRIFRHQFDDCYFVLRFWQIIDFLWSGAETLSFNAHLKDLLAVSVVSVSDDPIHLSAVGCVASVGNDFITRRHWRIASYIVRHANAVWWIISSSDHHRWNQSDRKQQKTRNQLKK